MRYQRNARQDSGDRLPSLSPPNDGCAILASQYWRRLHRPWSVTSGTLFLPGNYTPSYRYPLICHLHDHNSSDRGLGNWFPMISDQNFLAVAVRAPFPSSTGIPGSYRWSLKRPDATGAAIQDAIAAVSEQHAIHLDRIYLLAEGIGGVAALQYFLLQHVLDDSIRWRVQGIICRQLPSDWPDLIPPVMSGDGRMLMCDPISTAGQWAVLDALEESGYQTTHSLPAGRAVTSLINHWVLDQVPSLVI